MSEAVKQLVTALQDELAVQERFGQVLENKLDAMRHYDTGRLEALAITEQRLLEQVRRTATERQRIVVRLGRELVRTKGDRAVTAREIAGAVDEPERSQLLTLGQLLREAVEQTQRLNRINGMAARKLLGHFEHIFRLIAQSGRDVGLYGRGGRRAQLEQNRLIDALA